MCVSVANDTPTDDSKDTIRLVPDEREREREQNVFMHRMRHTVQVEVKKFAIHEEYFHHKT